jgi:hypothetical protein
MLQPRGALVRWFRVLRHFEKSEGRLTAVIETANETGLQSAAIEV